MSRAGWRWLLYCAKLVDLQHSAESDDERDAATLLLDILTPVAKSWPSQWCLEANSLAIQVHGGYGYTREYDVEQHYRDNRLNPIHEGTHGIQSLDLLGRKVTQRGGASLAALAVGHRSDRGRAAAAAGGEAAEFAGQLDAAWQRLVDVTAAMFASGDIEAALANSVVYLEAFGHIVVAWIWLEQVIAAQRPAGRLLRRQASGRALLLPLRTAQDRAATRSAGEPGPHHAGDARRLVLSARAEIIKLSGGSQPMFDCHG